MAMRKNKADINKMREEEQARESLCDIIMDYLGADDIREDEGRYVYDDITGRCIVAYAYTDLVDVYDDWDEIDGGIYVRTTTLYDAAVRFSLYVMYPFSIGYDFYTF